MQAKRGEIVREMQAAVNAIEAAYVIAERFKQYESRMNRAEYRHPAFAAEVPYAVVLVELEDGGRMIANVVESLFGAAFDWPLGAAISVGILVITISLLFLSEFLEKRWALQ